MAQETTWIGPNSSYFLLAPCGEDETGQVTIGGVRMHVADEINCADTKHFLRTAIEDGTWFTLVPSARLSPDVCTEWRSIVASRYARGAVALSELRERVGLGTVPGRRKNT